MIATTKQLKVQKLQEILMRDPFLVPCAQEGMYYLFGTTSICNGAADVEPHFEVWRSTDLINFEGPFLAFMPPAGYWGVKDYWAPEVHQYGDAYYLLGSFKGGIGEHRGTAILRAEHPAGPYLPHSPRQLTPPDQEALDGTLYVDDNGTPWMAYCQEWTSIFYGKINAVQLSRDLTTALPDTTVCIVDTATDSLPWIRQMHDPRVERSGYLTDAPYFHKNPDGSLLMLWSSYAIPAWNGTGAGGYVVAQVRSESGSMSGPWQHLPDMLLDEDTGHAAIFWDLTGELRLVCHCHDTKHGREYPVIHTLVQHDGGLSIQSQKE